MGDFAELGCWSGGCGIWAKACIDVYGAQVSMHLILSQFVLMGTYISLHNDRIRSQDAELDSKPRLAYS